MSGWKFLIRWQRRRRAYHDVAEDILTEFHPWITTPRFAADPRLLAAAKRAAGRLGRRIWFGPMVTGEQFIGEEGRAEILERFAPLSADMETAAAAHVCYVNQVPFLALRTITDTARRSGVETFEENCRRASEIARDLTLLVLEELKEDAAPLRVNTPSLVTERLILRRFEQEILRPFLRSSGIRRSTGSSLVPDERSGGGRLLSQGAFSQVL